MSWHPLAAREKPREALRGAPPAGYHPARSEPQQGGAAIAAPPAPAILGYTDPLQNFALYLLAGFILALYSRVFDFFLNTLHIPFIIACGTLTLALVTVSWRPFLSTRPVLFMLGLSAWLMMATPFSSWPGGSVELLKESWSKALLFFLVLGCMVTTTRQSITIMRTMAWAVLICALLSFRYGTYVDGRLQMAAGQYTNPNELGNLMAVGAVLWWSTLHYSRRSLLTFVLAIGCIALLLLVASRTGSRMVMLVLAASMPALLTRYSMAGRVAFVGASGLAFLMLLLALPGETIRRFTTFFTIQQEAVTSEEAYESYLKAVGSANQRVELLKTSVLFTLQHPVFGVGPGMFAVAQNEVAGAFGRAGAWRGTHNTYTELSSEAGIPALLLFVGAMITCWRQLGALRRRNDQLQHPARADIDQAALTIRVLMLGTAVQFLFIHAAYSVIFPTIAGLAVGLVRGANNDLDQVDPAKAPAVPFSGR